LVRKQILSWAQFLDWGDSMDLHNLIIPELEHMKRKLFRKLERNYEKKLRNKLYDVLAVLEYKKRVYGDAREEILSKIGIEIVN